MKKRICFLAFLLLLPALAHARWSEDWTARGKITVNANTAGEAVTEVPVAVRLHSGNFDFSNARLDGSDLRFIAADDKTELKYHIEKFDFINELAIVWVQLPKADPKDKTADTEAIRAFNKRAAADPRGISTIYPGGDGTVVVVKVA